MSNTPLKDAYELRKQGIDNTVRYSSIGDLEKGDYAGIKTPTSQYFGFIKSIGRVNVVIESPYGGYADGDYICIQDLKFPKTQVKVFCKPR